MVNPRTIFLILALVLSGCASAPPPGHGYHAAWPACPAGTYMICDDSLRGCQCGEFIVLN